jgi:Uma2 family endonuclease
MYARVQPDLVAEPAAVRGAVVYPDSDGEPKADNTDQFDFIHTFKGNLDLLLPDFVAGDHLWYPVEGRPDVRVAPDIYVALGRPKGPRGSYKQWEEGGVAPQVVFEWWSPNNDFGQQARKLQFYQRHGVQEFYTFDQVRQAFNAFLREEDELAPVATDEGVVSPLLGIRLAVVDGALRAWHPDGRPFRTMSELDAERRTAEQAQQAAEQAQQAAEQAQQAAEQAQQAAEQAQQAAEQALAAERARGQALADRLRALGIDPDAP